MTDGRKYSYCETNEETDPDEPDQRIADAARSWLLARPDTETRPFFIWVGFMRPHLPFNAPNRLFNKYPRGGAVPLAQNRDWIAGAHNWDPDWEMKGYADLSEYYGGSGSGPPWYSRWIPEWRERELRQAYWAATSYADEMAGIVIDALDTSPRRRSETIVRLARSSPLPPLHITRATCRRQQAMLKCLVGRSASA